jgi:peptide/nickel transport system permease protein
VLTITALVALFALLAAALFGERLAPNEPLYFVVEHGADPRPYDPGTVFPFGSDVLGRDLFSLVLAGARATLTIVLLAGLARVAAGVLVAALGMLWKPARLVAESCADFVAAIPATLIALVLVKGFVKTDTTVPALIGALLVMGWAGPYRVIRAEVDRLARAPFTEGARALGVSRARLFWRHQFPHLVPVLAMNVSQQVVASLVLVAELGVLGVLVGTVRSINIEESLTVVRTGPPVAALIPDTPEWGALLATSRTVEALWLTRWLIFVPGAAFALTAIAVATIGLALARRYARRDLFDDLRAGGVIGIVFAVLLLGSGLVPERYAAAVEWAAAARAAVQPTPDLAAAIDAAGLRTFIVARQVTSIARAGPASVTIGSASVAELPPQSASPAPNSGRIQSVVASGMGGTVDGPIVFAARGIVPAEYQAPTALQRQRGSGAGPELGPLLKDYPDDYANLDVRGKVVLLVRFMGIDTGAAGYAYGPPGETSISNAIKRGAAAVLFVDPDLSAYPTSTNPYRLLEQEAPATSATGVPVVVLDPAAAGALVAPLGLDLSPLMGWDVRGQRSERSLSRDLGTTARVNVRLRAQAVTVESRVAEVPGVPADAPRVIVWASRSLDGNGLDPARADALAALARLAIARHAPFLFVDFDPHADTQAVRDALDGRRLALVLELGDLGGGVLHFATANGDLIPAVDFYAQQAGARYEPTRRTALVEQLVTPLPGVKTIEITSTGTGDARSDAVALIGYLAGRLALGAPELQ